MSVQATGALNLLYIFDNFALDPDRRELRSGAAVIAMEPQAFDLLVYLIRQREQVVSRDELIESIWGGRIVSESALSTRINAVRSAIGDSGTDQRLIKTLPRKGIRFIGEVREERKPCEMASAGSIERHGAEIIDLHSGPACAASAGPRRSKANRKRHPRQNLQGASRAILTVVRWQPSWPSAFYVSGF